MENAHLARLCHPLDSRVQLLDVLLVRVEGSRFREVGISEGLEVRVWG